MDVPRRSALIAALAALAAPGAALAGHDEPGMVRPPLPVPDIAVVLDDGRAARLHALLDGRVTALQFVLTGCSAVCPVLGAIFMQVQARLASNPSRDVRLLSLSLDPLGDTAEALQHWRARYGAGPAWRAALPRIDQSRWLDTLVALGVQPGTRADDHTASVLIIDRQARLVFRSAPLPDARFIATGLTTLAASATPTRGAE
jgi:protein SCO1/2